MLKYNELLRNLRKDHDYSQEDIATYLKIERKTYNRYESESHPSEISFKHVIELAKLYNVSLDYLGGLIENPKTPEGKPYDPKKKTYIINQSGNNNTNNFY